MANFGNKRIPVPMLGLIKFKGGTWIAHEMTIGAAGAISSQTQLTASGLTAVKTATKTGRYTYTLPGAYKHVFAMIPTLWGPADAIWGANTVGGPDCFMRNNNIDRGTKAGTFDIQFCAGTDNSDADLPSGTVVNMLLLVGMGV